MSTKCPQTLVNALEKVGLRWRNLYQAADQIVLFGSRAAGVVRSTSDWDLLLVGTGKTTRLGLVDLVWINKDKLSSEEWLGGELAGHVAVYGHWLKGDNGWKANVHPSEPALKKKYKKIQARLKNLEKNWSLLLKSYRRKHAVLIRRDLQRYLIMRNEEAVIPTPMLDSRWKEIKLNKAAFCRLAKQCGFLTSFVNKELANLAESDSEVCLTIHSRDKRAVDFWVRSVLSRN